jgi:hypothetical protein
MIDLEQAVSAIAVNGFTERQARFLVLVARHSGVCVMRQYCAFAGVAFGHTTRRFFAKLERLGWVSTYDCARKRARIYHVRHRELYDAVGDPDSRLRRPPTVPRALERIMLLDVILQEPELVWLTTPEDKMAHVSALASVKPESMPQLTASQAGSEQVRYFPDHMPIGVSTEGRWVVVCLLMQDPKRELRTFLERHLMLLASFPAWTLRVAIPAHMAGYGRRLVDEARQGLRWRLTGGGQLADDVRWYFTMRKSGGNPDTVSDDDERAHRARLRKFSGLGFSVIYGLWRVHGDIVFSTVSAPISHALHDDRGAGVIEPLVLPHAYSHLAPLVGVA